LTEARRRFALIQNWLLAGAWEIATLETLRRFTRLTNAFSKKLENHKHAVALYFMHYNFCRANQTLRVTPAMEYGIFGHVWSINRVVVSLDRQALAA